MKHLYSFARVFQVWHWTNPQMIFQTVQNTTWLRRSKIVPKHYKRSRNVNGRICDLCKRRLFDGLDPRWNWIFCKVRQFFDRSVNLLNVDSPSQKLQKTSLESSLAVNKIRQKYYAEGAAFYAVYKLSQFIGKAWPWTPWKVYAFCACTIAHYDLPPPKKKEKIK